MSTVDPSSLSSPFENEKKPSKPLMDAKIDKLLKEAGILNVTSDWDYETSESRLVGGTDEDRKKAREVIDRDLKNN